MPRRLNFRQIEAFRAVMITGTTIGAARMLFTTQPSISRLLAQAQAATGLSLFERDRGRLRPTPEAIKLFEVVQRGFDGLEKIEQTAVNLRKSGTGLLRLGSTPALALGVLPGVIRRFRGLHADVPITLHTVGSFQLREGLLNGQYDAGFTTNRFHFQGSEFRTEVIDQTEAVCVMNRANPLAGKATVSPRDFASVTHLTLHPDDDLTGEWRRVLADKGISPALTIETTYSATICALAVAGVGVGVVNPYTARLFKDQLRIARVSPRLAVRTLVAYPAHATASALAREFVALLAAEFRRTAK